VTDWGLSPALSVRVNAAVRLVAAAGVNVTLMVQLELTFTTLPQLLVCAKSPALVPVSVMLVMVNTELPVLVNAILWGALVVPWF
jgi:hypothetical protein